MANVCCTEVQFIGDETAIQDLFEHLSEDWLEEIAKKYEISEADVLAISDDSQPFRGSITSIDKNMHRICQSDGWVPHTDIWRVISKKAYDNKISIVFKAEEPGNSIYVNTDVSGIHFPERFVCDYEYNGESDVEYFESGKNLLNWLNEKFGIFTETVEDAEEILDEMCENEDDAYFTIGAFQTKW